MTGAAALLDAMGATVARAALMRCCGCARWADAMVATRPFVSDAALHDAALRLWSEATTAEILEALGHHPEIGADLEPLRERLAATANWSGAEQAGVGGADDETLVALVHGNARYRGRFGFIFVLCATGKDAAQMLAVLRARLDNDRDTELANAAREQGAITRLRLDKLADTTAGSA